jgi:hypothetical protein
MTPSMSRRRVLQGLGMLGLGGVARTAGAQDPPPPSSPDLPPLPGTVGLLRGQFARLAVVSHDHGNPGGYIDPELIVAEIIGGDGKVLASADFAQLGPNEARFLDFMHPGTQGEPANTRLELFGRVRYKRASTVGGSLQIVDGGSGLTLFPNDPEIFQDPTLGNGQVNDAMPVAYPLPGTIGLVRGQSLRVSMVHHGNDPAHWPNDPSGFPIDPEVYPRDPCTIVADVLDGQGNVLATAMFGDLNPHQAVFLDFMHPGGNGAQRDTRMEVIVHVRYTPGHRIGGTVAVLDASTGQTGAIIDPELYEDPKLVPQQ